MIFLEVIRECFNSLCLELTGLCFDSYMTVEDNVGTVRVKQLLRSYFHIFSFFVMCCVSAVPWWIPSNY